MKISGNDRVIDELLQNNDRIVFNLIQLLRRGSGVRIYTDTTSYLTAQTNANCPLWVYVNAKANEQTRDDLFAILSEALNENSRLQVLAQVGFAANALSFYAEQNGLKFTKRGTLNAYSVRVVHAVPPVGKLIPSGETHEQEIARLIQIAAIDDNDGELSDEAAKRFAETHAKTGNLFLWYDKKVVSMARIVRYEKEYARITSVVTDRDSRGKGYAKMLVGELANRLLLEGFTPVLYARAENPSSNRCYNSLGFEKAGEISEFVLKK